MANAKFVTTHHVKEGSHLRKYGTYEYRGTQYDVCLDWNAEPLSWQHKSWQDLIDSQLDTTVKTTESYEVGFDMFWNFVNAD